MKTSMLVLVLALGSLVGCASKEEINHSEARTDGTRVFYNCSSLIQKQLVIQQFNQCYLSGPKTKQNRFDCEEVARSLACDRMVEVTRNEPVMIRPAQAIQTAPAPQTEE